MPTTTNFGWTTPADTDLVKDGALAIRTLGNGIDTSLLDLKGGTTDQYLAKNSNTDLDYKWVTPASSGKVLQVVNASYSTIATSTSATFADTGLTASITPSSATSKILVFANINGNQRDGGTTGDMYVKLRLIRGATNLIEFENRQGIFSSATTLGTGGTGTTYLDSPNTTSSTTYKVQFARGDGNGNIRVQSDTSASTITLMEIGA